MKRRDQKRVEAEARQEAYDALTPKQKYDRAVKRGHKNTREALRLKRALDAEKTK